MRVGLVRLFTFLASLEYSYGIVQWYHLCRIYMKRYQKYSSVFPVAGGFSNGLMFAGCTLEVCPSGNTLVLWVFLVCFTMPSIWWYGSISGFKLNILIRSHAKAVCWGVKHSCSILFILKWDDVVSILFRYICFLMLLYELAQLRCTALNHQLGPGHGPTNFVDDGEHILYPHRALYKYRNVNRF